MWLFLEQQVSFGDQTITIKIILYDMCIKIYPNLDKEQRN